MRYLLCYALLSCMLIATAAERPAVPAKKADVLRVVCFGDSITGDRPWNRFSYQKHYLKFADLLQLLLEGKRGLGKAEVLNSGWSGDKTSPKPNEGWPGAVGRLDVDLINLQPDIAIVLIGGNDRAKTDEQHATVQSNLEKIYQRTSAAGIKVLALQYHPALPSKEHQGKGWPLNEYANDLIAAAAAKHNIPVLDMGPSMVAAAEQYGSTAVANAKDGVHLATRGELVFARTIYAKLEALGWIAQP